MKTKVTIGIVAAALLFGFAGRGTCADTGVRSHLSGRDAPRDAEPEADQKQKAPPQQKVAVQRRAPTRIIVRPILRERLDSTEFPRSDYLGYPGPNAVRQCVSWLQPEYRPSGTVVTPQMRCWWQRG